MGRISAAKTLFEKIRQTQINFINMTSNERLEFISRYDKLLPYETTALIQCKKIMTTAERKAYKEVVSKATSKIKSENETPQPM